MCIYSVIPPRFWMLTSSLQSSVQEQSQSLLYTPTSPTNNLHCTPVHETIITPIITSTTSTITKIPITHITMSLFKSSKNSKAAASHTTLVDDSASIVSSAPSDITLAKAQNKATSTSSPRSNPSATKADPNRSWEARARKSHSHIISDNISIPNEMLTLPAFLDALM